MKELLEFLARSLVDHPDEVRVEETETADGVVLRLTVAKADLGKVIGKQGRIARALRTVIKASAVKDGKQATVEIVD
ncbi:MAG: KH domain-containing protein [Thermoleophilia bacterium]|nr:KH domain-containing protein [Thermoleophilia bacterium]